MRTRLAVTLSILLLAGALLAPTASEQYGAAAWRVLKTMMGSYLCTEASLCMFGQGIFYVDSVAEAQTALDEGCGDDVTGTSPTGCIIQFERGEFSNANTTLHLAGTGSMATGRSGVILRGAGGGTTDGNSGRTISGTTIVSTGTNPVIDVGTCFGCVIENLTIDGSGTATAGVDLLNPLGSGPTTRFVIRNVAMYDIDGYGIRTATSGQIDTFLIENVSVRHSDGCFQQRDTQNLGLIITNMDCSQHTSSGPIFDVQYGDFTFMNSFAAFKNNEVGFRFGKTTGKVIVRGNQIELDTSTSGVVFDFNEGNATAMANIVIDANHVTYAANGNTLFDVMRRGTFTVSNNEWQNTSGSNTTTSTFAADTNDTTNNRLFLALINNSNVEADGADAQKPERWIPTLAAGPPKITLLTPIISAPDVAKVSPCLEGEVFNDSDAATGTGIAAFQRCVGGVWVAP